MPDVYWKGGVQERQRIINKMLPKIRDDTFRTLSERRPEGKPHDSNTETSRPLGIEDLAASLNGLEFETSEASSPEYSPSELDVIKGYVFGNEETETIEEEDDGWSVQGDVTEDAPEAEVEGVGVVDDDDDEDGGVLLFRGR
ncbi:hypothetical protein NKR23_g6039 [Pleurostoma richardsiae]|uniref:Uncharacterized protein n=1 Tax=Pleurostoma richardsiae TaxID=41990 RepID=A0AA38RQL4_9PEZI|nr:hypothetical protein NKR23_g6039 [Pleurostoma richardsiae]